MTSDKRGEKTKGIKECRICGKPLKKGQEEVCSWKCSDTWEQEQTYKYE